MSWVVLGGLGGEALATARRCLRDLDVADAEIIDDSANPSLVDARVIVMCADVATASVTTTFQDLTAGFPLARVLLVTAITSQSIRALAGIPDVLRHVVGIDEAPGTLRARVTEHLVEHYLDRAAEYVGQMPESASLAKLFVKRAWRMTPPPRTVAHVSRAIGVRRSTLRDDWPFDANPKSLVDWALLGRAAAHRRAGASWPRAAARVGISKRRPGQICRRQLGCSLTEVDEKDPTWMEIRFRSWFRGAIVGAKPDERSA